MERANSISYMDLLVGVLSQHEKALRRLIEKLEKISNRLDKINRRINNEETGERETDVKDKDAENCNYII